MGLYDSVEISLSPWGAARKCVSSSNLFCWSECSKGTVPACVIRFGCRT